MGFFTNVNVGSAPNDGTGDSLRDAFIIINQNFDNLDPYLPNSNAASLTANITSTGTSTFNVVNISGNVVSTSNITAAYFYGNGAGVTGLVSDIAQYVTQPAQANITSVGTLTGVTLSGTLTGTTLYAKTIGNTGANLVGTLSTAAQTNITSLGTLTGLDVSGDTNTTGNLYIQAGLKQSVTVVNAVEYNALDTDCVILANCSAIGGNGNIYITLPNAITHFGQIVYVRKIDTANAKPNANVVVRPGSSGNILITANSFSNAHPINNTTGAKFISNGYWIKIQED